LTDLRNFNPYSTTCLPGFSSDDIPKEKQTTLLMYDDLTKSLDKLKGLRIRRLLNLGCGRAALSRAIAGHLSIPEVCGVDVDPVKLEVARRRIPVVRADLEFGLPFCDKTFDLVTVFGVFEHLRFFDDPIKEVHRVLRDGGFFLVCLPNLGSYVNRILFLFGYQPRNVEISRLTVAGVARQYYEKDLAPIAHIHTATLRALTELLEFHGFRVFSVRGGSPRFEGLKNSLPMRILDFLAATRPSLSRRIFVLARKATNLS